MAEFRILIADDDEDDIFLMESAFKESGANHQIDRAHDGQQLLNYLYEVVKNNEKYPDLILMDINMPGMDGMLALELLKASDIFSAIPVIMCSTTSGDEIIKTCKQNKANGFVSKGSGYKNVLDIAVAINRYLAELPGRSDTYFNFNKQATPNQRNAR